MDRSYQLVSLDESGLLTFWVVVEMMRSHDDGEEGGSVNDLGLIPRGSSKLVLSRQYRCGEHAAELGQLRYIEMIANESLAAIYVSTDGVRIYLRDDYSQFF